MASQLGIYNGAMLLAGERFLASLTEEREPRRLLDQVWADGGIKACLEMGQWQFATRTVEIDYDSSIEPSFGYSRAFEKPSDWVLTCALCSDEYFNQPLLHYEDEAGYWYADIDTLYVRYVSNGVTYGLDLNKWPESFNEVVKEYFCSKVVKKITGSDEKEAESQRRLKDKVREAENRSMMTAPTRFPARGSWGLARQRYGRRGDRGNTSGNLIG